MDGQMITISREGAEALRHFAQAMPYAADQIVQDTQVLRSAYSSIAAEFGQIESEFAELVEGCSVAAEKAADAISDLPQDLERTAEAIDVYLDCKHVEDVYLVRKHVEEFGLESTLSDIQADSDKNAQQRNLDGLKRDRYLLSILMDIEGDENNSTRLGQFVKDDKVVTRRS